MNKNHDPHIIDFKEYCDLKNDAKMLRCLEAAGVDNWEGYSYAIEEYTKYLENNEEE